MELRRIESGPAKVRAIVSTIATAILLCVFGCFVLLAPALGEPPTAPAEAAARQESTPPDACVVTGRVADAAGRGLEGATVEWGNNYTPFRRRQRVTTDANGLYSITLESLSGRNHLAASAPGYSPDYGNSRMRRGRQVRNFVLIRTPKKGHAISGTVVGDDGKPIARVRVEAFTPVVGIHSSFSMPTGRDYFAGPDRVARTDGSGHFRIENLPSGEVHLNLRSKHRHINDANYPVKDGVVIKMSGPGTPGVVQGRLVDAATGLPPAEADKIRIVPRYAPAGTSRASADGRFRTTSRAALGGKHLVYIYARGYEATEARLTALPRGSDEYPEILLTKSASIEGRLVDAVTGEPVAGAKIICGVAHRASYFEWSSFDKYADGYHPLTFVQHDESGPDGQFWFSEPRGKKESIVVFADGYQRMILKPDAREFDAAGNLLMRLKRESAFAGVVLRDGKPLANVRVSVSGPALGGMDQMYEGTEADADGKYKCGRLLPGKYHVRAGGYSRIAEVADGETKTLNLGGDLGPIRIHGNAPPSITINLNPKFDWEYTNFSTEADSAGEYHFAGLKPGKYSVSLHFAYPTGYISNETFEIDVTRDGQQIDFVQTYNAGLEMRPAAYGEEIKQD
jgi:protocatechuate 3,4-dioxygenase beta subunit